MAAIATLSILTGPSSAAGVCFRPSIEYWRERGGTAVTRMRLLVACVTLLLVGSMAASAQSLSSKPIRIVIPVAAGAATDILSRIAGDWLQKKTGLPVVIENRTGAGGNIALEQVAKGEPDGHTLLVATNGAITINPALFKKASVDTVNDVVPVAILGQVPQILAINSKLPAQTAQE